MEQLTRRVLSIVLAAAGVVLWAEQVASQTAPKHGGTLTYLVFPEPPMLTSALSTSGPISQISPKMFDGLVTYDFAFNLKPQLARAWQVSEDGRMIRFDLRRGVKWHDGTDFSSADVAFSVLKVWKVAHARGRSTFANVIAVDTPDADTAILKLSAPAPYLMNALASMESQIVPRHIYEGKDLQTNPANNAPIGTGPFKFVEWKKGSHIVLARNPDYWDKPKPYLDRIVIRFIPDAGGRAAALESKEADLVGMSVVPLNEVRRLGQLEHLGVETKGYEYLAVVSYLAFNLDREPFKDVRVRKAIAHAIDRNFVNRVVWFGYGKPATGPIHQALVKAYSAEVPNYAFDPAAAEKLLDEAGFKKGANGVRFRISHDYMPFGEQFVRLAEYVRQALAKVGIEVEIRNQDYATFVKRVFTDRDFDLISFFANNASDPTIGVQRFYWSKNFQPGVAFSNSAKYLNPEMDRLLEAAQVEPNESKRKGIFAEVQKLAMTDLPYLPLTHLDLVTVYNKRVRNHTLTADGIHANFADVYIAE
jgi:peptide/nickel transport system substrate-binding protein